ncbi:hypothetical protein PHMEG_00035158 [Phytophthora megakarya]|uniref:Uncharacterized protein n=1 Tax=Phytophthora megakarya TaxID=4795 RepID=A0A225UPD1_9STRA|nr:hypothetical protein PHMEG_00035158 [Phytophthora megakarya]
MFFSPSIIVTLSAFVGCVQAHGYVSQPKATFKPGEVYTNYVTTTSASINKGFDGGIYNHEPVNNAKQFAEHWSATGYKSLRDMLDTLVSGCGNSDDSASPVDVSSFSEMWWQNNEYKEGFLESHHGPCEAWIDDTKIFHYDDCRADFTGYPAKIPTDYSSCKGNCKFVFYWLALHSPTWQVYKNCVPISNGGSGTSTSNTPSSTTSNTPSTNNSPSSSTGNEAYNFSMADPSTPKPTTATLQANQWENYNNGN